ncbi:MAG: hypothetical protein SH820_10500 [Xanthomonadales bacterium]|nr:hypothetical protein [Xanthomonadales bacterium]
MPGLTIPPVIPGLTIPPVIPGLIIPPVIPGLTRNPIFVGYWIPAPRIDSGASEGRDDGLKKLCTVRDDGLPVMPAPESASTVLNYMDSGSGPE